MCVCITAMTWQDDAAQVEMLLCMAEKGNLFQLQILSDWKSAVEVRNINNTMEAQKDHQIHSICVLFFIL